MALSGLVAYGSSSGESDSEDDGPTITLNGVTHGGAKPQPALTPVASASKLKKPQSSNTNQSTKDEEKAGNSNMGLPAPRIAENFLNTAPASSSSSSSNISKEPDFHISDEEDDFGDADTHFLDDSKEEKESDIFKLISKKLPAVKHKLAESNSFVDKNEDTSDIVKKVDYGDKIELPPSKKKKKEGGPVRISIPSLKDLQQAETDADAGPSKPKITASKKGSGLMSLLPDPVNKMTRSRPLDMSRPETGEDLRPARNINLMGGEPVKNNLKPMGVRKSGLVPHVLAAKPVSISKPPKPAVEEEEELPSKNLLLGIPSDSDDEGDDNEGFESGSYFPGPDVPDKFKAGGGLPRANTAPEPEPMIKSAYGLKRPPMPQPILPSDQNFISFDRRSGEDLGPAVSVYPPPAPGPTMAAAGPLIDSEEAITKLAGKAAKRREFEDMKIIDINEDQMRGDPNVWLTKAMTEEQAPRPDRKAGPKGLSKSKHQITYLAHLAKERDWELQQEWSTARANKKASQNKYGF